MERWTGRVAVVTGASGGIGASVAVTLADAGLTVVGLARRPHLVEELAKKVSGSGKLLARGCDVSQPQQVEEAFTWVNENYGGADVLINNAAVIYHGNFTEFGPNVLSTEDLMSQIDINIKSVILCTRHFAANIKKRGATGHLININSVAGHYIPTPPVFNVYPGTKHAITAITKSLKSEFGHFQVPIKVTSLSPGLVQTEMAKAHRMPELATVLKELPILNPKDIADSVIYLLSTPPHVNIDELTITSLGEKMI